MVVKEASEFGSIWEALGSYLKVGDRDSLSVMEHHPESALRLIHAMNQELTALAVKLSFDSARRAR